MIGELAQSYLLTRHPACSGDSLLLSDTFCTGKVVKDEVGNADSAMTGNEYLANLDYIEGVEKLKQGYESEAYCSDTQEDSNKKTLVTMTTGALKKHGVFQMDSSSGEGTVSV